MTTDMLTRMSLAPESPQEGIYPNRSQLAPAQTEPPDVDVVNTDEHVDAGPGAGTGPRLVLKVDHPWFQ